MVHAHPREEDPVKKVRKLSLSKETVRNLTDEELKGVAGATGNTCGNTCPSTCSGATCDGTCGIACNQSVTVCQNTDGTSTCSGPTCK
jgi:hypothetical protein